MAEEKNFENRVKKYLEEQNCWFVKYWGGGAFTKAGIPDLLCCVGGQFLAIELKASNGKPSELQKHSIRKIWESGGFAILLYPNQFYNFTVLIDALQNKKFDLAAMTEAEINGDRITVYN